MDKELNRFVSDIKHSFAGAEVLLFGSRAKGTARPDSDYDLIVVSKSFKKTPFVDRARDVWLSSKAAIAADVFCYSPDEIKQAAKKSTVLKSALEHAAAL